MRTFDPWEGELYKSGEGMRGVRLLILGESHYSAEAERPTFTKQMIQDLGQKQSRFRFYAATQRLVAGGRGRLSDTERVAFWEQVAFYNYIQSFVPRPRIGPSPDMWSAARDPFLATLAELKPHMLLVLGLGLRDRLPGLPAHLVVRAIPHPSSFGFKYADWQPQVQAALDEAVAKVLSLPAL